jgi:AraC family transcriptional regulator
MNEGRQSHILQALEFIESHLDQSISATDVAQAVGFSEYHFHRIFSAWAGESVTDYMRARRLSIAARRLSDSSDSILDIAIASQFESQEAFTRAFKRMFQITPGYLRKTKGKHVLSIRTSLVNERILSIQRGTIMQPKIVTREAQAAIGMGGAFEPKSLWSINKLWNEFLKRTSELQDVQPGYALGICASELPGISKAESNQIAYVAAMPVYSCEHVPPGMMTVQLPAGKYAVFTHSGALAELPKTIDYIWGDWVPNHKDILNEGPDFELYDERFNGTTLSGEIDIYLPLKD